MSIKKNQERVKEITSRKNLAESVIEIGKEYELDLYPIPAPARRYKRLLLPKNELLRGKPRRMEM